MVYLRNGCRMETGNIKYDRVKLKAIESCLMFERSVLPGKSKRFAGDTFSFGSIYPQITRKD